MLRKYFKLLFIFLAISLSAATTCPAQYHDLDPSLAAAAKEYDRAQMQADPAAQEKIVADDYMIMRGNGTIGGKKLLIEVVAGDGMKNDPYTIEKPFQRIYNDVAILGGWVHLTGTDHGKPWVQNARFADTWAKRNGKWQVVFTSVVLADTP